MLLISSFLTSMTLFLVVGDIGLAFPETIVAVDPEINVAAPGESFDVNVTVTNVTDLYAFDINMTFNPSILNCTGVEEGAFLKQAGATWWFEPDIRNDKGYVLFGNSLFPAPSAGANGNGTLATITFKVLAEGTSSLDFSMTALNTLDEEGVSQPIAHTRVEGTFIYPLNRDVAVTDVSASPSSVTAGQSVSVNVTVKNEGSINETFSVAIFYDSTEIGKKTVTDLASGNSQTLSFSWDTTGVDEGTYTIKAVAGPLSGETDIEDNTNSEVVVTVTVPPPTTIPIELIVGIVLSAAAACALIFFYIRRRK